MAKGFKVCKVCGKKYEYCKTFAPADKFRWQDVACSPECGAKYFSLVEASRSGSLEDMMPKPEIEINEDNVVDEIVIEKKSSKRRTKKVVNNETEKSE